MWPLVPPKWIPKSHSLIGDIESDIESACFFGGFKCFEMFSEGSGRETWGTSPALASFIHSVRHQLSARLCDRALRDEFLRLALSVGET